MPKSMEDAMAALKYGDRVRIASREPKEEDAKTGLYYSHFGGLTGSIQKVYSETEVIVDIELDSLKRDQRRRHDDVRDEMKTKWLEDLSEIGRSRLTEREKDFVLRYAVLISPTDLEKIAARPPKAVPSEEAPTATEAGSTEPVVRKTTADLEAAEEAYLREKSAG